VVEKSEKNLTKLQNSDFSIFPSVNDKNSGLVYNFLNMNALLTV
jgi:hypothetical protein